MQEEQENIHPNLGSPKLSESIRDNINYQIDQSVKRTLLKQSMLKISIDKDVKDLFEANQYPKSQSPSSRVQNGVLKSSRFIEASEQIKQVCHWMQEYDDFCGIAHIPFHSMPRLVHILHQKIEGRIILITEYPSFWIAKMEEIGRLVQLKWGLLIASQQSNDKVRVLELYQLKQLKLLFITPNTFKCQEYHNFECELLIVDDLHLYQGHSNLIASMISRTNPNRVLALYHTLMPSRYSSIIMAHHMYEINKPRTDNFNFIVLKTSNEKKFKSLMTYITKNDFKRILILVNKKEEACFLNKKLLMESKTSINLFDYLTQNELDHFLPGDIINRLNNDKEEEKIYQLIKRINNWDIVISKGTDFLRFCQFDTAIYYTFTDVPTFIQSCFTTKQKLLLFSFQDYHNYRNFITSELVTLDCLRRIVMNMVEKPRKREEQSKKRFYSDAIDDKLFDCYTVSKLYAEKDQEKVIKINSFCNKYQISSPLFTKIMNALEQSRVVSINYRTIYEIQIHFNSITCFKKRFAEIEQVRRRVNLLNASTGLHKTIQSIVDDLKKEGVKYKITEEAIQIKIIKDYEDIDWKQVHQAVNEAVTAAALNINKSFEAFKDCAYSSIELTRREKALQKKNILLDFYNRSTQQGGSNLMESYHKSNLLTSEIQEWIRNSDEVFSQHDLVLLLQGVEKGRISRLKDDAVYGRYRTLKYQELMEAITRIYRHKKVKFQ